MIAGLFPLAAAAQDGRAVPIASQPVAVKIDLSIERGRMTVPVAVGDSGPFAFVIDTGAERSVIARELAARLGLAPGEDARLFDFVGPSAVATVRVPGLTVGEITTPAIDAPALTLDNLGAPGMLGIDALQGRRVTIDFDRRRIEVRRSKRHAQGEIVVDAEERLGQLIVTEASFEGQPISVIVDTGSWLSVGNSAMLALAKHPPRRVGPVSVTAVTGRSFETELLAVSGLRVGDVRLDNVGLSFADVAPFDRFGLRDTPALILGMSALSLFRRVEIDFANREIAFTLPRPRINFATACRSFTNCRAY